MMDRHIDTIFEYRDVIKHVRPSIDGCSKEVYERIRAGGNFDKLLRNLIQFTDRNARSDNPYSLWVNCTVSRDNFHEIAFLPEIFRFVTSPEYFEFSFINSLAPSSDYFFKTRMFEEFYHLNRPCTQLWSAPHILKDGSLTTCCRDYDGDLVFGHLEDGPIKDAYNNDQIRDMRESHLSGSPDDMPKLCRSCYSLDGRINELFQNFIRYFYIQEIGRPAHLQMALNDLAGALENQDFKTMANVISALKPANKRRFW